MQKAQTIESPAAAKTRVTDILDSAFDTNCIEFCDTENEKLLNQIRLQFEKDMRDAIESSNSSKLVQVLQNANLMAEATLLNLNPCKMDYNSFKTFRQNKVGQVNTGDCALQLSAYNDLSKQFQKQAKDIFLQSFLHEISTIAEAFKNDIKLLEEEKKLKQDRLEQEEKAKDQKAINELSGLNDIFINRVGRGFFRIFGRGEPNLQRILSEIGLENIQANISIDDAKHKLIDKFGDATIAKLAFKAACDNKFNATAFDEMKKINDNNSQLIDLVQRAINEKKKLEKENQEMKAEIEEYKNAVQKIQSIDNNDMSKEKISEILKTMKIVHQTKLQGDEEAKNLMNKLNENIVVLENAMKEELKTQDDKLKAKLSERQQKKNVTTVPQVNDNTQQSSKSLNQNHENDLYRRESIQRTISKENLHVQTLVSKRRNSQSSQGSPREQQ